MGRAFGCEPDVGSSGVECGAADGDLDIAVEDDAVGVSVFPDPSGFCLEGEEACDGFDGEVDLVEGCWLCGVGDGWGLG